MRRRSRGKLGVLDVETEMTMLADLASALGPGKIARVDANGVYTVPTARRVVRTLAALGIGWLEDPCRTLDDTARLRADGPAVRSPPISQILARAARSGVPTRSASTPPSSAGIRRTQTSSGPAPRWASTSGATAATPGS